MRPGAVAIWPVGNEMEVVPLARISWGALSLTLILTDGRRIPLPCTSDQLAILERHYADAAFFTLSRKPAVILPPLR